MNIGIMGLGVVGSTLRYGFTRIGHEVLGYDVKHHDLSDFHRMLTAEIIFVCVQTPRAADGSCDTAAVEAAVGMLATSGYSGGPIVIKSTVPPGTTDALNQRHYGYPRFPRIAFCPEFLREQATLSDFVDNHEVCVVGVQPGTVASDEYYALIEKSHGHLPRSFARMRPIEAELLKYFCNTLNATRIVFASQFFEVCEALGADYSVIKNAAARRASVGGSYLDCNKNFRKFGGSCLPKDLSALAALVRERGIDAPLFDFVLRENERLP